MWKLQLTACPVKANTSQISAYAPEEALPAAEMVSGQQLSCRCYLEDLYKHTHVSMDMMWVSRPITVLLVSS